MMRHYLVVSDLHFADIEDNADGWKAYKHSRFTFDEALSDLVDRFLQQGAKEDARTLILNGDIIDFDLVCVVPADPPWPVSWIERRRGLEPTEAKSIWKLERVLADHPSFVEVLARFLAAGHRVVYVAGNHDPELYFEGVRKALVDNIFACARQKGWRVDPANFIFEPWFYYVPGEIYAEHGQQHDSYSTFRYVLAPVVTTDRPPTIALPMANLSNRLLMSRMGFFNPHASDFILNIFRYALHWLRHYAWSRRALVWPWLFGSLAALRRLFRTKRKLLSHPPDMPTLLAEQAERSGLPLDTVKALHELRRGPISNRAYRVIRELWIDRAILAVAMTGVTVALALLPLPLWVQLMLPLSSFPLLYLIYEWFAHGETIFSVERSIKKSARAIAELLPVKVITMGHTHVPELVPLAPGVSYVNTGTWAPVTKQGVRDALHPGLRNALFVSFGGDQPIVRLDTNLELR